MILKVKLYARDQWVFFPLENLIKATLDMNGSYVVYVKGIDEPMRLCSKEHGVGEPGDFENILKEMSK